MTVLLQWLIERAWVLYAVCAAGAIFYVVRALLAQRDRGLALFTLERETAVSRMVRAWAMVVVCIAVGVITFLSITVILPGLPIHNSGDPLLTPTPAAGVEPPTPGVTPTLTPTIGGLVATATPVPTRMTVPTPPPPDTPTPTPADAPEAAIANELQIRFGDFAELIGYSLPVAEATSAQPLQLTLYWRALEGQSPLDYMVFTHALSESGDTRLVAQHDGQPAGGARSTTSWSPGETIVDVHPMAFLDAAYVGPVRIEVGLYDPGAPEGRVLTDAGSDRVVLPVSINIVSP